MPCEIWDRIGTLLLPDDSLRERMYRGAMREVLTLSLACSNLNTALVPTRRAAEQVLLRIKLTSRIWTNILDEMLSDDPDIKSGHSTYFSVICDYRDRPLLYYDGPGGKIMDTAQGVCRILQKYAGGMDTSEIVDGFGDTCDSLSILVTTVREEPSEKVKCYQTEDVQLFSLTEASVRVIADTIIKEGHPWNTDEVFEFYSLGFKPVPEPAMLAYQKFIAKQ